MNSHRLMLAPLMTEHRTGKNYRAGRDDVRFGSNANIPIDWRSLAETRLLSAFVCKADRPCALRLSAYDSKHAWASALHISACDKMSAYDPMWTVVLLRRWKACSDSGPARCSLHRERDQHVCKERSQTVAPSRDDEDQPS